MGKYIARRILIIIPTLFGISVIVFSMIHFIPGDPIAIMFGRNPDPEQIALIRSLYNLDKPVILQYFYWISNILRGDMGQSISRGLPVATLIVERMPRTLILTVFSTFFALIISLPGGIISAAKQNTWWDFTISSGSLILLSMPGFWKGILAILIFSVTLRWFPTTGYASISEGLLNFLHHITLPTIALGTSLAAVSMRILRSSLLEVLRQDYITVARAKGLQEKVVLYRHALRNALIPTLTVVGMQIGYLFGGTIIIERVFSFPGLGLLLLSSFNARDYPLIQGQILIFAFTFVFINLITDILYSVINPRIRYN